MLPDHRFRDRRVPGDVDDQARHQAAQREVVEDGKQPLVAQLAKLRAIGPKGAWMLFKELWGWQRFANRRELAGCLGLASTPYDSDGTQVEQVISKVGNKRARALLVERWSCRGACCDCSRTAS